MPSQISTDRPDLPALTGVRFFAAFFVLITHAAAQATSIPPGVYGPAFVLWATLGMVLFFVLSGFVMQYMYAHKMWRPGGVDTSTIRSFAVARFSRLYPLYLLCLAIILVRNAPLSWSKPNDALGWLMHLVSIQDWFYVDIGGVPSTYRHYGLTWSISAEIFFYLVFPLLACLAVRRLNTLPKIIAAIVVLIVGAGPYFDLLLSLAKHSWFKDALTLGSQPPDGALTFTGWLTFFSPLGRLPEFILGAFTAQAFLICRHRKPGHLEATIGRFLGYIGIISVIVILFMVFELSRDARYYFGASIATPHFILAPAVAVVLFCLSRYPSNLKSFFSARPLVSLGEASYSIYLLHPLIIFILNRQAPPPVTLLDFAIRIAGVVALTLLVSRMTYLYFESPVRYWLRNCLTDRTPKMR